jgi:hypothetical protein
LFRVHCAVLKVRAVSRPGTSRIRRTERAGSSDEGWSRLKVARKRAAPSGLNSVPT